jgi:hypothetical protein
MRNFSVGVIMKRLTAITLALAANLALASPAAATIETQDYTFTVTAPGPIPSHSGSFTLTYDTIANSYTLQSIDYSIGSTIFDTANTAVESFVFGFSLYGTVNGPGLQVNADDFFLTNDPVEFGYTTQGDFSPHTIFFDANAIQITRLSGVPEPAAWAFMLLGFGGVGLMLRSRQRSRTVLA